MNSLFQKTYLKHSLGVEWLLAKPLLDLPTENSNPYIFVAPKSLQGSALEKMMERMIIAIKQTPQTVQTLFVDEDEDWKTPLNQMISTKKIMVFGGSLLSGSMGEWTKEGHHYFMLTNGLQDIKKQPSLKKETWLHLQKFVGIQ